MNDDFENNAKLFGEQTQHMNLSAGVPKELIIGDDVRAVDRLNEKMETPMMAEMSNVGPLHDSQMNRNNLLMKPD